MKIYTRTGDDGTTGLFGGSRVPKSSLRVEAYGTVDESNAAIGRVRASLRNWPHFHAPAREIDSIVAPLQSDLFVLGAELATPPDKDAKLALKMALIDDADCARLEQAIDAAEEGLQPLRSFILPGGNEPAAALHLARCVARRAERNVVALAAVEPVRMPIIVYLNRLSDLLFVLARRANHLGGTEDVPWIPRP